jgi:hypothetical protein
LAWPLSLPAADPAEVLHDQHHAVLFQNHGNLHGWQVAAAHLQLLSRLQPVTARAYHAPALLLAAAVLLPAWVLQPLHALLPPGLAPASMLHAVAQRCDPKRLMQGALPLLLLLLLLALLPASWQQQVLWQLQATCLGGCHCLTHAPAGTIQHIARSHDRTCRCTFTGGETEQ